MLTTSAVHAQTAEPAAATEAPAAATEAPATPTEAPAPPPPAAVELAPVLAPESNAAKLQGAVTELDAVNATPPKLYAEMPKFDCLSFSARSRKDLLQAGVRMEYGNLGISWVPGEYPYICGVTGGGGAERAGIRAGDTLIAVNGVSAYGLSPESVNNLVTGIRGQAAIVSITRGGTPHNVYAQYTGIQDLSAFEQPRANWWLNYWRGQ